MNIKPPNKGEEKYRKYKYLIWRDDVGFMHLDSFSLEELKLFAKSISSELNKKVPDSSRKSLTIKD